MPRCPIEAGRLHVLAVVTAIVLWSTFPALEVPGLGYLTWKWTIGPGLVVAGFLAVRHRLLAVALVATSPYFVIPWVGVASAVLDYGSGTARLQARARRTGHYLDPDLRVYRQGWTCLYSDTDVLYDEPYDRTLIALVQEWGPMRGTYQGPYPDRATTRAWLVAHERPVTRVLEEERWVRLTVGSLVVETSLFWARSEYPSDSPTMTGGLYAGQLLILRRDDHVGSMSTVLIDPRTDTFVAHYRYDASEFPAPSAPGAPLGRGRGPTPAG